MSALLDALESATAEDLEKVQTQAAALRKKLESLEAVERLLHVRLHGRTPRKSPMRKENAAPATNGQAGHAEEEKDDEFAGLSTKVAEVRRQILRALSQAKIMSAPLLADRVQMPKGSIHYYLNCDWFRKSIDGWSLTDLGQEIAAGLPN